MDRAKKYFRCTARERACFEAGIKLATVYHQFVGTPVSMENVESLERAIENGVRIQPFVKDVQVRISREKLRAKRDEYDYLTLTGSMLKVVLVIKYENVEVTAEMRYIEEMDYPLMIVNDVRELT
ncbi:MAG: dihydroneopterin aldolase family protein [Thermoplasmata archaeon]|nr:dihydroneopterin aldolase family protein [Thermoplasmata archaeon]